MNEKNKTYQLIVRQKPSMADDLEPLLIRLKNEFGLDSYTARQRLTGQGLAMFGRGNLQQTNKIAAVLQKLPVPLLGCSATSSGICPGSFAQPGHK